MRPDAFSQFCNLQWCQVSELYTNTGELPRLAPLHHRLDMCLDWQGISNILEADPDIMSFLPSSTGDDKAASRRKVIGNRTFRTLIGLVFKNQHRKMNLFSGIHPNLLWDEGPALVVDEIQQGASIFPV